MNEKIILDRTEHHLLSMQMDDSEPLFILYADTVRDVEGATLDTVLEALIKLINLGFSKCIQKKWGKWRPCENLTLEILKKRFKGLSEEKKKQYPEYISEYYFEITAEGRLEEAKEIYDDYYPKN
jgi:hypothetical protein